MAELFDPIEPFDTGHLDVGDGHVVYWEASGNPEGTPMVTLHGGPGGGSFPGARRQADPARHLIVQMDQRGCGRSTPLASDPDADLSTNTTQHLIGDLERLRGHLGVPSWKVVGLSWGTTLGLAYAQAHPEAVSSLVLIAVTTTSRREVKWLTEDVGRLFPEEWDRFASFVPDRLAGLALVDAYAELLFDEDPATREAAALEWCEWEAAHVSLVPGHKRSVKWDDPAHRMVFSRLVTHYWRNGAFLPEGVLLEGASGMEMPGVLVHGRYDVSSPAETPWLLSRAWKGSSLHLIDDAGHGGSEAFLDAMLDGIASMP